MKKAAILLVLITIISKIFSFARGITLPYFYETSSISAAYLISITIPAVIFSFIGASISAEDCLYNKIEQEYGEKEGNKYTNNLVNILIIIIVHMIILGLLFTDQKQ
ncbi:hypothetical protein KQI42_02285 [Tissierella sp. MSJ-40]|uniref:Polysaccharide biosynthesis protein n=1 Tax=Tissierella simiarum TaxID=2841534 RepID=A0ABS6E1N1_9FIRM|nr:hypothetical protein [Tissierella simiarum]MBU5436817.1 hypothetical protein [Tissierella simiarum]